MLQYFASAWNREVLARCSWMAFCFVILSPTLGHPAEKPIRSTEHNPAFCHVRTVGLVCYQLERHLPTDSSAGSLAYTGGSNKANRHPFWLTQPGPVPVQPTSSSQLPSRTQRSWVHPLAQPILISELRSTASKSRQEASVSTIPAPLLFRDGFESGDFTGGWSEVSPNHPPVISLDGKPEDGGSNTDRNTGGPL